MLKMGIRKRGAGGKNQAGETACPAAERFATMRGATRRLPPRQHPPLRGLGGLPSDAGLHVHSWPRTPPGGAPHQPRSVDAPHAENERKRWRGVCVSRRRLRARRAYQFICSTATQSTPTPEIVTPCPRSRVHTVITSTSLGSVMSPTTLPGAAVPVLTSTHLPSVVTVLLYSANLPAPQPWFPSGSRAPPDICS